MFNRFTIIIYKGETTLFESITFDDNICQITIFEEFEYGKKLTIYNYDNIEIYLKIKSSAEKVCKSRSKTN